MNGFADRGLDEDAFGEKNALGVIKAFDAFPKTKPSYTQQTSSGGVWTLVLIALSTVLAYTEVTRWRSGTTTHSFSVEQGVGHDLQINVDLVVAMKCEDIHINVQDAAGDRVLVDKAVKEDSTLFRLWGENRGAHTLGASLKDRLEVDGNRIVQAQYQEEDVHDYLSLARGGKRYQYTPRTPRKEEPDSCRIYGSMHSNKVQGDFHITARGHGYMAYSQHLDHSAFNFSHHINELSFGPYYPKLVNPLDSTFASTEAHFHKFQYYLSVVPTIYTVDVDALKRMDSKYETPSSGDDGLNQHPRRVTRHSVFTNQYAVTEQSHSVPENQVPGIFFKYDIEPLQLTIAEEWTSVPALLLRIVNVVSGLLVAGGWCFQLSQWAQEISGRKRGRTNSFGMFAGAYNEKAAMMS
ncbi:COPII-coated vesicle protein (Erv41) [Zymoseptoria brevis]|uniref:Endoplasmic reticulum-Golgi intermediate compartment protein n=1 Tax=Zymoseptoria brevis TaxID=1047168 RepID=A0A0F4GVU2_9PEZI|nr:COPII-coated vesicle protein (Erv41) [Zymoseptoria brevis]